MAVDGPQLPPSAPTGGPIAATPASVELAVQAAVNRALAALLVPGSVVSARLGAVRPDGSVPLTIAGRTVLATATVPLPSEADVQLEVLAGDGPRRLRLVGGGDRAQASSPQQRLAQLGVARTPLAAIALAAFEAAGAPLSGERLRATASALAALPAGEQPVRAAAHAALAVAGAPATPALVALATRAVAPALPDAATAVRAVQVALAAITGTPLAAAVPALALAAPNPAAAGDDAPANAQRGPALRVETLTTGPRSAPPAPPATALVARTLADAIATLATLAIPDAGRDGADAVRRAFGLAGIRPGTASDLAAPADAARIPGGRPPAEREGPRSATLLDHVADSGRALRSVTAAPAAVVEARAALDQAAREIAAPTVLRPAALADYAVVVPLLLSDRGQPTPARLAISRRPGGGGADATYLRIDAQLSRLGTVSVRLSALDHGPMAIAIVAGAPALAALDEVLPELEATLHERGLVASLRLAVDDGGGDAA